MAYQFSFDGKSLWALGGGSLALCVLIFFAGLLLGANWRAPETTATAAAAAPAAPNAARTQAQPAPGAHEAAAGVAAVSNAALPYEPPPAPGPAFYDTQAPRDYAARGYAQPGGAQGYSPQDYAAQDYGTRDYAGQGYAARPAAPPAYGMPQQRYVPPSAVTREAASAPPVDGAREAARLSRTGADAEPRVVSEADTSAADAPYAAAPNYCVQVGAFTEEAEARRLLAELEHKGYAPAIFSGRDGGGRTWYAVRIGAYSSQQDATLAAQNFNKQERQKAAVRPANSL